MKKTLVIISREYLTRVRKKMFLITTLLLPLLFVGLGIISAVIKQASDETYRIAVVDESGLLKNKFSDDKDLFFITEDVPFAQLRSDYQAKGYTAILHVPTDFSLQSSKGAELLSAKQLGFVTQSTVEHKITDIIRSARLKAMNVDEKAVEAAGKDVRVNYVVTSGKEQMNGNTAVATGIGYIAGFLIYIVMLLYGNMVLRSVMEEKQTRIVEVIMSSVKPMQLMMGKILGVGLVGLTQFVIWIVLIFTLQSASFIIFHDKISALRQAAVMDPGGDAKDYIMMMDSYMHMPWGIIITSFLFYFLGGYLLYAALFAAVGSAMSEDMEDNRGLNFIVTFPIIISLYIMLGALAHPHSTLSIVGSLIPFSSPIVMSARLAFGIPPLQLIVSMILLIAGFFFTTWIAARIYRTAILMYGKKITPKELLKWAFQSK